MDTRTRTALILGAGGGLGHCIAAELQHRGHATIEVGSSLDDLRHHANRLTLHCDLADSESVGSLLERLREVRTIDAFYWIAGNWWAGEFAAQPTNDVVRMVDVNLRNPLVIAQWVWRLMRTATTPRSFVVCASTSGMQPRRDQAVYTATKAAQIMLARSLGQEAVELRVSLDHRDHPDIRVALFNPGGMRTLLFAAAQPATYAEFMDPAKVAAYMINRVTTQAHPFFERTIDRKSELGRSLM